MINGLVNAMDTKTCLVRLKNYPTSIIHYPHLQTPNLKLIL